MKKFLIIALPLVILGLLVFFFVTFFTKDSQADTRRYPEDFRLQITTLKDTRAPKYLTIDTQGQTETLEANHAWLTKFLHPREDLGTTTLSPDTMNRLYEIIESSRLTNAKPDYHRHDIYGGKSVTIEIRANNRTFKTYVYEMDVPEIKNFAHDLNALLPDELDIDWP